MTTVDPDGLMEFSVVFTDRSLNHMSAAFQEVMRDISSMLREVYKAQAVAVVPGGGTYGMEAEPGSSRGMPTCWWCVTAGSPTGGARSSRRAASPPVQR